ncbi:transmembrane protein, putative [Medicago truncatula]|uniref:Transmembrane protein, putative n=1 Tax=Medicago truncatula TaxID=3880 RepID=A0A072U7F7_MEDTR|nr:transmembrane protein, putative [Medicago truncatula]
MKSPENPYHQNQSITIALAATELYIYSAGLRLGFVENEQKISSLGRRKGTRFCSDWDE